METTWQLQQLLLLLLLLVLLLDVGCCFS